MGLLVVGKSMMYQSCQKSDNQKSDKFMKYYSTYFKIRYYVYRM